MAMMGRQLLLFFIVHFMVLSETRQIFQLQVTEEDVDERIVGGNPVNILEYPYQVSLEYFHRHRCGGSIISETWVLSAAHCTQISTNVRPPLFSFTIRVGTTFQLAEGQVIAISKIVDHPLYGDSSNLNVYDYDITLIQLSMPLTYTDSIRPVALPAANQPEIPGARCNITGWGALTQGGVAPSRLHMVATPWISNESCNQYYNPTVVTPAMMCSGSPYGGRDACQGDSGGPLVVDINNQRTLIGVVSWGAGCAQINYPGVYAYVVFLRPWIAEVTGL
ncbi:trypsin-7-like [Euwallacea fornicatus]|uniref:trypsin-7-like n=1 Tax=Euwallacea fornicatus TaxID=995702 RepID=UPI00338EB24D